MQSLLEAGLLLDEVRESELAQGCTCECNFESEEHGQLSHADFILLMTYFML